jgi:hypothetical protein
MRYKTFFRVILKAIGVYLVVQGLTMNWMGPIQAVWQLVASTFWPSLVAAPFQDQWVYYIGSLLTAAAQIAIGLYFFLGGEWIVNMAIPSNRPYCVECGYDLSQTSGERCPECGRAIPPAGRPDEPRV